MEKKYNKNRTENSSEILNLETELKFFHKIKNQENKTRSSYEIIMETWHHNRMDCSEHYRSLYIDIQLQELLYFYIFQPS